MKAALVALALLAAPAPAGPHYAVRPATSGAHFNFGIGAGSSVSDAVIIDNVSDAPLRVHVYGADLVNLPGGGVAPRQPTDHQESVGAWMTVGRNDVVVAPHGEETVPFSVAVPPKTGPGDYAGAVVAAEEVGTPTGAVQLQTRLALQVQVRVPGVVHFAGRLSALHVDKKTAHTQRFHVTLTNDGNVSMRFDGHLDIRRGGKVVAHAMLRPNNGPLLPGGTLRLTGTWVGRPIWGSAKVQAAGVATAPDGAQLTLTGSSRRVSYVPWWLILLAVVALALAITIVWRRLRMAPEGTSHELGIVGEEPGSRKAA
jgi:hypothetical protein